MLRSMFGADDWGGTTWPTVGPEGRHLLRLFLSSPLGVTLMPDGPKQTKVAVFLTKTKKTTSEDNLHCLRLPEIGINACRQ